MDLYLFRHAKSIDRLDWKGPDRDRPLTEKGKREFRDFCDVYKNLFTSLELIYASPYLRTSQTLEVLKSVIEVDSQISEHLVPQGNYRSFVEEVESESYNVIGVIGHNPELSLLARLALMMEEIPPLKIKKGALIIISDAFTDNACLSFSLAPSLLKFQNPKDILCN